MGLFGSGSIVFDIFVFPSVINYILSFNRKSKNKFFALAILCLIIRVTYECMMMEQNFYEICGVKRIFTKNEIDERFTILKPMDNEMGSAFQILKNLQLKIVYDKFGKEKFRSHDLKDLTNPSLLFWGCVEKAFFYGFSFFLSRYIFKKKKEGDNIVSKFYLLTLFYMIFECSMILDDQSTEDLVDKIIVLGTFQKLDLIRSTFWSVQNIFHYYFSAFDNSDNVLIFFRLNKMQRRLNRLRKSADFPKQYEQMGLQCSDDIDETKLIIKELEDPKPDEAAKSKGGSIWNEAIFFLFVNCLVYYLNRK